MTRPKGIQKDIIHTDLRLPREIHEWAQIAAKADDRSLNNWLVRTITKELKSTGYLSGSKPKEKDESHDSI